MFWLRDLFGRPAAFVGPILVILGVWVVSKVLVGSEAAALALVVGVLVLLLSVYRDAYVPALLFVVCSGLPIFYYAMGLGKLPIFTYVFGLPVLVALGKLLSEKQAVSWRPILAIVAYVLWICCSAAYHGISILEYKAYFVPLFIAIYVVLRCQAATRRLLYSRLSGTVVIIGVINGIVAVLQSLDIDVAMDIVETKYLFGDTLRVHGLMEHPTIMGAYFAMAFCVSLGYVFEARGALKKAAAYLASITISAGLLCVMSRGAILGAVAGAVVFTMAISARNSARIPRLILVAAGLVFVFHFLVPEGVLSEYIIASDSSTQARMPLNRVAIDFFLANPVFGIGIGKFSTEAAKYMGWEVEAHNTYLGVLAEYGLPGFVLFLTIIWMSGKRYLKSLRATGAYEVSVPMMAGFFGGLAALLVDGAFHSFEYSYMLWFMISVGAAYE